MLERISMQYGSMGLTLHFKFDGILGRAIRYPNYFIFLQWGSFSGDAKAADFYDLIVKEFEK